MHVENCHYRWISLQKSSILWRLWHNLSRCVSSFILKVHGRQIVSIRQASSSFFETAVLMSRQPEWYFTHVLNVIHEQKAVMEGPIQRLLHSAGRKDVNALVESISLEICRRLRICHSARIYNPSLSPPSTQTPENNTYSSFPPVPPCTHDISSIEF